MDETAAFLQSVDVSASRKVEIPLNELVKIFLLMEDLNTLLHQPENLTYEKMESFLIEHGGYQRFSDAFYNVVWNWLPADIQQAITDR